MSTAMIVCTRGRRYRGQNQKPAPVPVCPEVGREYIVSKYWIGTFRGRIVAISELGSLLRFLVTNAMRSGPLIEERCPYPECTGEEGHDGEHEFSRDLRNGDELEIRRSHVDLQPVDSTEWKPMPG